MISALEWTVPKFLTEFFFSLVYIPEIYTRSCDLSGWAGTDECLYDSVLWLPGVRFGGVAERHGEAKRNVTVSRNTLVKATSKQEGRSRSIPR